MTSIVLALAFSLTPLITSAYAQDGRCQTISNLKTDTDRERMCRCGDQLRNVTLTPPKGLQLIAACYIRQAETLIDIPPQFAVNLDHYDRHGKDLDGIYYFRGRLHIAGRIRYEPNNGGELFFVPAHPIQIPRTTIEPYFRILTLIPENQYWTFKVTKSVRAMGCAEARAEIVIDEVTVIANGSEEAGAYPTKPDLVRISRYKPCRLASFRDRLDR